MSDRIQLRPAREADVAAITAIYNEAVLHSTATFDITEQPVASRMEWFRKHSEHFPVFVAETQDRVVAYASLSHWSDKPAYDITAEFSLYVEPGSRGRGIGRALAEYTLEKAKSTPLYTILSLITDGNVASLALHEKLGFTTIGTFRRCGRKFGDILDVVFLQKILR